MLTTQYLDEADQLADTIGVMDRGKLIAQGTSDELKQSVGGSSLHLTVQPAERMHEVREVIERVLGSQTSLSPEQGEIRTSLRDISRVPDVLIILREHGIRVMEMSVKQPTLDEVFMALTSLRTRGQSEGETNHEQH